MMPYFVHAILFVALGDITTHHTHIRVDTCDLGIEGAECIAATPAKCDGANDMDAKQPVTRRADRADPPVAVGVLSNTFRVVYYYLSSLVRKDK